MVKAVGAFFVGGIPEEGSPPPSSAPDNFHFSPGASALRNAGRINVQEAADFGPRLLLFCLKL